MERIKAEVRRRNIRKTEMLHPFPEPPGTLKATVSPGIDGTDHYFIPDSRLLEFEQDGYHINDFLKYHNQDFVINAFRGILMRNPDQDGFEHFLKNLRSGLMTKVEIMGRLRYSPEGRAKNVKIRGLAINFAIRSSFRIPILGYLFHIVAGIANLPAVLRNLHTMETAAFGQLQRYGTKTDKHSELIAGMRDRLSEIEEALPRLEREKGSVYELEALRHAKVDKGEFTALHRSVVVLEERLPQIPGPVTVRHIDEMDGEGSHFLDAFYALFEDRFRGTRQDIRRRSEIYLPYIQRAAIGTADLPILDLGCGRGEWLELLKENNYIAAGVDKNRVFVQFCKDLELDVLESDAIEYLKSLKANSYGVITGFQIAEHLSLTTLVELLDESLRVLKEGGIMILETPNPENLIVGSCDFYTDPTHRNPIPPSTLEFLMEARGFVNVEKRTPQKGLEDTSANESEDFLGAWVNRPPDYAMIGSKMA